MKVLIQQTLMLGARLSDLLWATLCTDYVMGNKLMSYILLLMALY